MTTRLRSASISKGFPVNYCSGFRSLSMASAFEVDGLYHFATLSSLCSLVFMSLSMYLVESMYFTFVDQFSWLRFWHHSFIINTETLQFTVAGVSRQNFNLEVNAVDYGFEPTNTPRTDRSVEFLSSLLFSFLHGLSSDLSFDENTLGSRQPHSW